MTTRTIERPKVEKLTAPSKRWRNRWRAVTNIRETYAGGRRHKRGDEYWGLMVHPSKEIAEEFALKSICANVTDCGYAIKEYLGAFPVEAS